MAFNVVNETKKLFLAACAVVIVVSAFRNCGTEGSPCNSILECDNGLVCVSYLCER